MTDHLALQWAITGVSLFNTLLMLWLGLTVLINAERRTWGVALAGGALLLGAAFFVSHTILVGNGLLNGGAGLDVWWRAGWMPVVLLPLVWYGVVLWYAGYWNDPRSPLRRRHRLGPSATMIFAGVIIGLLVFANPLPTYSQLAQWKWTTTPSIAGLPSLVVLYPIYIIWCIALSVDALRRPAPSTRMMGDAARRRAHPWLVATTVLLLAVALLVSWALLWLAGGGRIASTDLQLILARFDIAVASLIAAAVLTIGQAIVSYEVFTGRALPRRDLLRQWRGAIALAAAAGLIVGGAQTLAWPLLYVLLSITALLTAIFALSGRRAYAERQRYLTHLRPFVASQRLVENLLAPAGAAELDVSTSLRELSEGILGARQVQVIPLGPLATLAGPPRFYPPSDAAPPNLNEILPFLRSPQTMSVPLEPSRYAGAQWAVPLWNARGLIGALLLGEKRDGGLYAQEEIEIARAAGERLLDTLASAEMARRLMTLQRQRFSDSQALERQTRRTLHDDVLPALHAALLQIQGQPDAVAALSDVHRQIAALLREMPAGGAAEVARLGLIGALRQAGAELADAFDAITWEVSPAAEDHAGDLSHPAAEALYYAAREAMRNAARHGRGSDPSRPLHLHVAATWREGLELLIQDDGVGIGAPSAAGAGVGGGLALHSTLMAVAGGALSAESVAGAYTRVTLFAPAGQ